MIRTVLKIDGMACGMCEAHINDCLRRNFNLKKIKTTHGNGESVILSDSPLAPDQLKKAVSDCGYTLLSVSFGPYEKKGLFSR